MASIKKDDKTGTYLFVIDLPRDPVTGSRKQAKRRGFKTKKEAQQAAAELLYELTKGTHIQETNMSFKDFSDVWLNEYKVLGGVKESTYELRVKQVNILQRYFYKVAVKDITRKMYQDAITDMRHPKSKDNKPLEHNTVSGAHGVARMLFKRAMQHDMIKTDPTEYAKLPARIVTVEDLENKEDIPDYLEKEELALFLKTALEQGEDGDYETFLTLAYTGLRIGEFAVLCESDIDFIENSISITKTLYNKSNRMTEYKLQTPKTKKSTRVIGVDPIVTAALKSYIQGNKEFKMLYRKTYHDRGFVMPSRLTSPGYPKTVRHYGYRMTRLLKLAGLNTTLTPHSLRHTHASLLAEAGVPLQDIMDRLGHQDDHVTKNVYIHVTKTKKVEAAQKFSDLMANVTKM